MQCPTCGSNTPGTLGNCSNCNAPIDREAPLGAPVADPANAQVAADKTMMVPPPMPAWAPPASAADQAPAIPGDLPAEPPGGLPVAGTAFPPASGSLPPAPSDAFPPLGNEPPEFASGATTMLNGSQYGLPNGSNGTNGSHGSNGSNGSMNGGAQPQGGRLDPASPLPPAAQGSLPPADPESTAAWTFDPDADDEPAQPQSFEAPAPPPPPPSWANGMNAGAPSPYSTEPPAESIVPDSWFAHPRQPDEQSWNDPLGAPTSLDSGATMMDPGGGLGGGMGQGVGGPGMVDPNATMMDAGRGMNGHGGMHDQTMLDPGQLRPADGGQHAPTQVAPGMAFDQGMPYEPYDQGPFAPNGGMGGPGGPGMQGGPGMPGDPNGYAGYQQPAPSSGGKAGKPLLIGVGALVAVAVIAVGVVMFTGDDKKDPPAAKPPASTATKPPNTKQTGNQAPLKGPAKQQAADVNDLLDASAGTKRQLAVALGKTGKCDQLPGAISGFQNVAQRRQNQLHRTQNLELDKLQRGEEMRASLREAFQASLEVDQALLSWAQQQQSNCHGKPNPDAAHAPGRAAGEQKATAAKRRFVKLWAPVAKAAGQPARRWTGM
ncbi:hypothetical protein J4573_53265 [Actinomadura barringtoniae]|uniref:Uncharacterized protein n=1 Tax=Actinomadura barringtoniae TaxID=1427535 RepID=A0A939PVT7_9ACTN|nr:hypothetical protein [Actinomadura barringtoniae]MBO2455929.1 hypothetical protein [Actinomadura barringtoniae]